MNREIKFRAWDTYNQRMVMEPYLFRPADPLAMKAINAEEWQKAPWVFYETWQDIDDGIDRPCFIMQFTGLLDKKGKEIYEGDIIARMLELYADHPRELRRGQVVFHYGGFCMSVDDMFVPLSRQAQGCEIIGNIYEHPELLAK